MPFLLLVLILTTLSNISVHAQNTTLCLPAYRDDPDAPPVTSTCDFTNVPLTDGRKDNSNSQCRVLCYNFSSSYITATVSPVDCSFCDDFAALDFTFDEISSFSQCIPRGVCIKQCGYESPGCIYTGSCTSQTCFTSTDTGQPAQIVRATYAGPVSIIAVPDATTNTSYSQVLSDYDLDATDTCDFDSDEKFFRAVTAFCADRESTSIPLANDELDLPIVIEQCRAVCTSFADPNYEIIRIKDSCDYCGSTSLYKDENDTKVCIPDYVCERECGTLPPGCVHTGTCSSRMCFSGLDSKKPAEIIWIGVVPSITVDNTAEPTTIDPPAFAGLRLSIDSDPSLEASIEVAPVDPVPSETPLPSVNPVSSEAPLPSGESPSESSNGVVSSGDGGGELVLVSDTEDISKATVWTWLGIVIGIVIAAIAVIVTFVVAVRESRSTAGNAPLREASETPRAATGSQTAAATAEAAPARQTSSPGQGTNVA